MYQPDLGVINYLLKMVGLGPAVNLLGDKTTAMPAVMAVMVWIQLGYPLVIFMAGLQRIDPEMYEAAALTYGATWFRRFRSITVWLLTPRFVVVLTTMIHALKVFAPIYAMTTGGPGNATIVAAYFSYKNFFERSQVGYGAAVATVLTLVILIVAVLQVRYQTQQESWERTITNFANRSRFSNWMAVAMLTVLLLMMLGPLLMIVLNSFKSEAEYLTNGPLALPQSLSLDSIILAWNRLEYPIKLGNSLYISLLSSLLAIVISLLNAYAMGIGKVRGATFFLIFFIIAITLPGDSIYPQYYLFKWAGFYDTRLAVIVILAALNSVLHLSAYVGLQGLPASWWKRR